MKRRQHLRISDAEREQAAAELGEHYAQGRLTAEEHAERLDRIWAARTRAELAADLPRPARPATYAARRRRRRPPSARARPVAAARAACRRPLLVVLAVLLVLTVAHAPAADPDRPAGVVLRDARTAAGPPPLVRRRW